MRNEVSPQDKKARRKAIALKISVWGAVFSALLGIPVPPMGAAAFVGAGLGLIGLIHSKSIARKLLYYALASFALVLGFLSASPWRDAPPIEDDYTIADLLSADPAFTHTYELLKSTFYSKHDDPNGAPAIGLNRQDVDFLRETGKSMPKSLPELADWRELHRDDFLRLWNKTEEARSVISRLAEYEQIADLTAIPDTTGLDFQTAFDTAFTVDIISGTDLMLLARLYRHLPLLMIQDGHIEDGLNELSVWNKFSRKRSVTARDFITKLGCYGALSSSLETANEIANHPDIENHRLERLQRYFPPLTLEQVSLRNPLIYDYLANSEKLSLVGPSHLQKKWSSIRMLRNFTDIHIARSEGLVKPEKTYTVWPFWLRFLPNVEIDAAASQPWYYRYYNPVGYLLSIIFRPPMARLLKIQTGAQIRDDLLQCVLSYRLEGQADLTARAYSEYYVVDVEKKRMYSPGPDGVAFTKDDIWLPIDPAVLGLKD